MAALTSLRSRLLLARLYLCTDTRQRQGDLGDFLREAFAGGVDVVQVRQKHLEPETELGALEVARAAARPYGGIVCVNDSPRLAGAFGADMLHLGQTDGPARSARRQVAQWALLGRSTHSRSEARSAADDPDLDYFSVGPVYPTPITPDHAPVGLDLVRYACAVAAPSDPAAKPWFAIGGINGDTLDDVLGAGARRVAVVRAITEADDPQAAAAALSKRLRAAWRADPAMERYTLGALAQ